MKLIKSVFNKDSSTNSYVMKAQQELKMEESVRMMEFINMYNLKRNQIVYQCPIIKNSVEDPDFEKEVQCLQEMADLQIIYNRQKQAELSRIRKQEQQNLSKQEKLKKQRSKSQGFFGKMFGSKEKNKQSISVEKPKLNESALKSSKYLLKSKMKSSAAEQTKFSRTQSVQIVKDDKNKMKAEIPQINIKQISNNKNKDQSKPKKKQQQLKKTSSKQQKQAEVPAIENILKQFQNQDHKNIFDPDQLLQIDEDDLQDAPDDSIAGSKKITEMSKIKEEDEQSFLSQDRYSKVSRVSIHNLQNKPQQIGQGRYSSKRNRKIDSEQEQQKQIKQQKQPNFKKKKSIAHKNERRQKVGKKQVKQTKQDVGGNKQTQKWEENKKQSKEPKKSQKQKTELKRQQSQSKNNQLSSYIEKQLSKLSAIHDSKQNERSMLQVEDILDSFNSTISKKPTQKEDSFSDVKIDWMVKLEACELEQKLLLNRLRKRWNTPLQTINKIRNLHLSHFTQQISRDPKLSWVKPNFNFGRVIE